VNLYAESSAVLSWLLGEPAGAEVAATLAAADEVIASDLTLVECDRVLVRGVATGVLTEAAAAERRHALARAANHWHVLHLVEDAVDRARRPYPVEPIRTLDALHLSLALVARAVLPDLKILCLDHRIRENALAMGLQVEPPED
jgi:predicted nucleic acid-binding protein